MQEFLKFQVVSGRELKRKFLSSKSTVVKESYTKIWALVLLLSLSWMWNIRALSGLMPNHFLGHGTKLEYGKKKESLLRVAIFSFTPKLPLSNV